MHRPSVTFFTGRSHSRGLRPRQVGEPERPEARLLALLLAAQRLEDLFRGDRHFVDADADGVVHRVRDGGTHGGGSRRGRARPGLWVWAVGGPPPAPGSFRARPAGVCEPTFPRVPAAASASCTASAKLIPRSGLAASNTRPPANVIRSTGASSFGAVCRAMRSRARSAAWMAAFPVMSVTRLE